MVRGAPLRMVGLVVAVGVLVLTALASIAVGSKAIPLRTVLNPLLHYDSSQNDHLIIRSLRSPRTMLGVLVGMALGLAGAAVVTDEVSGHPAGPPHGRHHKVDGRRPT